ncbi:MAG: hypothetical protein ACXW4M_09410, partial [Anaerolineales bacterium]
FEDIRHRPDVVRLKRRIGMTYGMTVGLSFAASAWGENGYLLSQAHALYPWLKLIMGAIICATAGGLAGWLVARFEKGILALLFYLGASFVFAWLIVYLPLQIFPRIVLWLDPETGGLLNYIVHENFNSRFAVAWVWVALFVSLAGILQIPLAEPAVFSTSFFGKIAPLIVCSVIMLVSGTILDTVTNEPLRSPILEMDDTIKFSLDHRGEQVDRALARTMHMTSLRGVQDVIDQPRRLIVGSYDQWLGQVNIFVRFGDTWVDCVTVYNQPSFCKYVIQNAP